VDGSIQHFQIYKRTLHSTELSRIAIFGIARKEKLTRKNVAKARNYYFERIHLDSSKEFVKLRKLKNEQKQIERRGTYSLVMDVKPNSKPTAHVLIRGEYSNPDKEVLSPNTPAGLPSMTEDMPKNRLGLAMWLTDKSNPLHARVTANCYWYHLFGKGIVSTNKDFGIMGARLTHPQLLDYLAVAIY